MEGPQRQPQSQFCRSLRIFFPHNHSWDTTQFLFQPILENYSMHLMQLPSAKHTDFFFAHKPAQIIRIPSEWLWQAHKNVSHQQPIPQIFLLLNRSLKNTEEAARVKPEQTSATSDQRGQQTAKLGSVHGEHSGPLLKKASGLGFWQRYEKGDTVPSEIPAATTLPGLQEQAVEQQQPLRSPQNSSSAGDTGWEKHRERQQVLLLFPWEPRHFSLGHACRIWEMLIFNPRQNILFGLSYVILLCGPCGRNLECAKQANAFIIVTADFSQQDSREYHM